MRRLCAAVALSVACATGGGLRAGWTTFRSGPLQLDAPAGLRLVEVGDDRFLLEPPGGMPVMEARISPWCPDAAEPGAQTGGRFASALGGLPRGGEDRFYSILAGRDRCVLLRFYGLWDEAEKTRADLIAQSVRWNG